MENSVNKKLKKIYSTEIVFIILELALFLFAKLLSGAFSNSSSLLTPFFPIIGMFGLILFSWGAVLLSIVSLIYGIYILFKLKSFSRIESSISEEEIIQNKKLQSRIEYASIVLILMPFIFFAFGRTY